MEQNFRFTNLSRFWKLNLNLKKLIFIFIKKFFKIISKMDFFMYYNNNSLFKKQFKEILNNEISLILKSKTNICGAPRSRNRGICMRQCKDIACIYHINNKKNILPSSLVDLENKKNNKKYPIFVETIPDEEDYYKYKNSIYDIFDIKKINISNNIINKEIFKIVIRDVFFDNIQKSNTPKLICYYNEKKLFSSSPSSLPIKKIKKNKNKKNKKKKHNIIIQKEIEEGYKKLLDLNNKITIFIHKNNNLKELDKNLLISFINKITNNINYNETTNFDEIKKIPKDIYIKLNKYIDFQIDKNNKKQLFNVKGVFNLYQQIFDEKYKEDYDTDPIHFMT